MAAGEENNMDKDSLKSLQLEIIKSLDLSMQMNDEEIKSAIDKLLLEKGKRKKISLEDRTYVRKEVFYSIRRMGLLQELIDDLSITEIMVNGTDPIFIERDGKIEQTELCFESPEKVEQIIQQIVSESNRVVNEASPIVDAGLKGGLRINAVLAPVAINGPILTIRRFPEKAMTVEQLILADTLSGEVASFLKRHVVSGSNMLVCGGTGCGKTTFLNVLSGYIPLKERIITIEDSAELRIDHHPNLVRLETRNANVEGCREITIRDLLKTSLRMRPDRIIVGEVRGKEAIDMLQSVNVGHTAMTSVHANGVRDVVSRLETMVLMGMDIPLSAVRRQIVSGFDLFIHLGRVRDGSRKLLEIAEPVLAEDGTVTMNTLYYFKETENDKQEKVCGRWIKSKNNMCG